MHPTHTKSSGLMAHCLAHLMGLEERPVFNEAQQHLYDSVVGCTNATEWQESSMDQAVYRSLLQQLQLLESNRNQYADVRRRVAQVEPSKAPDPGYI